MRFKNFFSFILAGIGLTLLLLLVFVVLYWFQVPTGRFFDWVVGITSFWWLLMIVTVPWNIHFHAKEVLAEAMKSKEKGIAVKEKDVAYVSLLSRRAFIVAIALHLLSALGLYALAATGISSVGYVVSGAALLLTGLRPAVRLYEYIAARLAGISREFRYPREDVYELRHRVVKLEEKVKDLEQRLNPKDPTSWATNLQKLIQAIQDDLTRVRVALEDLRVTNQTTHEQLSREAQQAIAKITEDGQFLEHVREIIRFFKSA